MSPEAIYTLAITGIMVLALVFEIFEADVTIFSALGLLMLGQVISPQEAIAGFANKGMLTVAVLFVVAYAAQASGVLEVLAERLMGVGSGLRRSQLRMMTPVVALSAFLNNTPIVAMFTPTIRDWAIKRKLSPSKFLIPLSYASIFGGVCTLIGTSTNLVVNGLFQESTGASFSMFELAYVGLPCAAAGMLYLLFFGNRILPERRDLTESLADSGREYLVETQILPGSPLAGKTVEAAGLRNLNKLFLAEIVRPEGTLCPVKPQNEISEGDRLVFTGQVEDIVQLQKIPGLAPIDDPDFYQAVFQSGRGRVIEAVVSRSSPMLGKTIKEGNFRGMYDAVVLAVHRNGERLDSQIGQLMLKPGDTLLLLAGDDFLKRWSRSRDFYMITKVSDVPAVNRRKMYLALGALTGMVLLAATGVLDIFSAAILAAVFLLLTRCVTAVEARRSLEINVLVVIAGALGISQALEKSGAAGYLAGVIIDAVKDLGPMGLLAAIYLVTSLLTEVITNNAAAALVFPIATAAAVQAGLDPKPFAIAIAVAASASFATPIGYQTNLMVYGPGGYRFSDFIKVGVPLNLLFMAVALVVIPRVWVF